MNIVLVDQAAAVMNFFDGNKIAWVGLGFLVWAFMVYVFITGSRSFDNLAAEGAKGALAGLIFAFIMPMIITGIVFLSPVLVGLAMLAGVGALIGWAASKWKDKK